MDGWNEGDEGNIGVFLDLKLKVYWARMMDGSEGSFVKTLLGEKGKC